MSAVSHAAMSYPGPPPQELPVPPMGSPQRAGHAVNPGFLSSRGSLSGDSRGQPLLQKNRPVATPSGALAALWGDHRQFSKEPFTASAAAPSGPPRRQPQASPPPRASLSPSRQLHAQSYVPPTLTRDHAASTSALAEMGSPVAQLRESPMQGRAQSYCPLLAPPGASSVRPPQVPCMSGCATARARSSAPMTPSRQGFPDPQSPPVTHRAGRQDSLPMPPPPARQDSRRQSDVNVKSDQDLVHQHVLYILRKHPELTRRHKVLQVTEGVYLVDGHEVSVEWRHALEPGMRGYLVVVDGPMRQPLVEYLSGAEAHKEYDTQTIACTTSLHHVPKDRRMTFDDTHKQYTRLEAMKVAKEQASLREKAADYTRDGKQVPDELVRKYNKVLRQKLRHAKSKEDVEEERERRQEPVAVPAPAATPMHPPVLALPGSPLAPARGGAMAREASRGRAAETPQAPPPNQIRRQPSQAAVQMAQHATQAAAQVFTAPAQLQPVSQAAVQQQMSQHQQEQAALSPFPAVTMMTSRGISLNGIPNIPQTARGSFQPPMVTRSWSGVCPTPRGDSGSFLQGQFVQTMQMPPGVAAPAGSVSTAAPTASLVVMGHVMAGPPAASPPASFRQRSVSRQPPAMAEHYFPEQQYMQEQQYFQEQQFYRQQQHQAAVTQFHQVSVLRQMSGGGSLNVAPPGSHGSKSSLASVAAAAVTAQTQGGIVWRP